MDVIFPKEAINVNSISELTDHLRQRQGYFLSTLQAITNSKDTDSGGWQSLSRDQDNKINKQKSISSKDTVFTGSWQCVIASRAIQEGIEDIIQKNNLDISVKLGDVNTTYNAEDWDSHKPTYSADNPDHTIVKVVDNKTKEVYYFDPTYAQIDHRYAGKFLCITQKDFPKYYKDQEGVSRFGIPSIYYDEEWRKSLPYGITKADFDRLVTTITS